MLIITAGSKYIDIDVLACSVAYKHLLHVLGQESEAVHTGVLNSTVTKTVRSWNFHYSQSLHNLSKPIEGYVIVDISDPERLEKFVDIDKVVEIYDHHFGFEDFWKARLTHGYHIEAVGAAATLIYEQYKKNNIIPEDNVAKLLYTAIISNTLNFKAEVTTVRDKNAANELLTLVKLEDWDKQFFLELQEGIFENLSFAIKNDANSVDVKGVTIYSGQLELWDGKKFLDLKMPLDTLKEYIRPQENTPSKWFLTIPCIKDGYNIIITDDRNVQELFTKVLNVKFKDNIGYTDKLLMRKEIKREFMKE